MKHVALALTFGVIVTFCLAFLVHPIAGVVAGFGAGYLSLRFRTEVWPLIWDICPKTRADWGLVGVVVAAVIGVIGGILGFLWLGGQIPSCLNASFGLTLTTVTDGSFWGQIGLGLSVWVLIVIGVFIVWMVLSTLGLLAAGMCEMVLIGLSFSLLPREERDYSWPKLMLIGLLAPLTICLWLLWLTAVVYSRDRLICACWGVVGGIAGYQTTLVSNPKLGLAVGLLIGVGLGVIQYALVGLPIRRWFDRRAAALAATG